MGCSQVTKAWLERFGVAPKRFRDGTHRVCPPDETLTAFGPRMGEFGITRLADVTGLDIIGIPVYMAVRPNARSLSVSQGKGLDRAAAKSSALMESIEGWHAEHIQLPLRYASYAELRGTMPTVDITQLPLRRGGSLDLVKPMLWVEGYELVTSAEMLVPFECVSTYYVQPDRLGNTFLKDSNGLASGNHILEAMVHGLCETVERDACTLWTTSGGMRCTDRKLDLNSISDPNAAAVIEQLQRAKFAVGVWDVTSDTGIPTFFCRLVDAPGAPRWAFQGLFGGQGCHLDSRVAILRALTEAAQGRLTQIAGARDDMSNSGGQVDPEEVRVAAEIVEAAGSAPFRDEDLSTDSFEGDVEILVKAIQGVSLNSVIVVDLSHHEKRIPVVRMIVPGLEPPDDHPEYVPGPRALAVAAAQ